MFGVMALLVGNILMHFTAKYHLIVYGKYSYAFYCQITFNCLIIVWLYCSGS